MENSHEFHIFQVQRISANCIVVQLGQVVLSQIMPCYIKPERTFSDVCIINHFGYKRQKCDKCISAIHSSHPLRTILVIFYLQYFVNQQFRLIMKQALTLQNANDQRCTGQSPHSPPPPQLPSTEWAGRGPAGYVHPSN